MPLNLHILKKRKRKSILIYLFVSCELTTTLLAGSMTTLNVYRFLNIKNIHVYTHTYIFLKSSFYIYQLNACYLFNFFSHLLI